MTLATPNYGYEKRQKELAKKRKKEDKLKAKSDRKHMGPSDGDAQDTDQAPLDGGDHAAPPAPTAPSS